MAPADSFHPIGAVSTAVIENSARMVSDPEYSDISQSCSTQPVKMITLQ